MVPKNSDSNYHGLLIGVGADLAVTVKDAFAINGFLIDPKKAAYSSEKTQLLTEASATRQYILDAFDRLITRVRETPDSTVIVYYSGHGGYLKSTNEYFLVPYGFDPAQLSKTAIFGQEFTEKIEAIQSKKLIVILDCCHAGGIPALKEPGEEFIKSPVPPDLLNALSTGSGRVVIASSRADEYSYTGNPYSLFTTCLLEALQGKASVNKDGYARILDVLVYLFDQVPKRAPGSQHPFVNKILDLGDNFPICYYAGGSKALPDELPLPPNVLPPASLTPGQRQRLQQQQQILQAEYDLRSEKFKRLRTASSIETSTTIQFQLEQQILAEEAQIAQLANKLDSIEPQLLS